MYFTGMEADEADQASSSWFKDLISTAGDAYGKTLDHKLRIAQPNAQINQNPIYLPTYQPPTINWMVVGGVIVGAAALYYFMKRR